MIYGVFQDGQGLKLQNIRQKKELGLNAYLEMLTLTQKNIGEVGERSELGSKCCLYMLHIYTYYTKNGGRKREK